jgi:hypothetical protein
LSSFSVQEEEKESKKETKKETKRRTLNDANDSEIPQESGLCLWRSDPDADGNTPKMPLRSDMNADESGEKRPNVRSKAWTEMAGRRQGPIHLAYTLVKEQQTSTAKKI